jgi:hypothetical protein
MIFRKNCISRKLMPFFSSHQNRENKFSRNMTSKLSTNKVHLSYILCSILDILQLATRKASMNCLEGQNKVGKIQAGKYKRRLIIFNKIPLKLFTFGSMSIFIELSLQTNMLQISSLMIIS